MLHVLRSTDERKDFEHRSINLCDGAGLVLGECEARLFAAEPKQYSDRCISSPR